MIPYHFPLLIRTLWQSIKPGRITVRNIAFVLAYQGVILSFLTVVNVFRLLDHLVAPGFRRAEVKAPLYILGNPRSGTTFLHRLMCLDARFTYFKLWQTILPSVLLYRLIALLQGLDRLVGRPLGRLIGLFNRFLFSQWDGIHATGMEAAEEDEMFFMYYNVSPAVVSLYPYSHYLPEYGLADTLPGYWRRMIAVTYRGSLKRHLHTAGRGKTLLAKNALMQGRIHTLMSTVPDMRIVHIVRHPYDAIPSFISMFSTLWKWHSPKTPQVGLETKRMAQLMIEYYKIMHRLQQELPPEQIITIMYDDLIADPKGTVEKVYNHFNIEMDDAFVASLAEETSRSSAYSSNHNYSLDQYGIKKDFVYNNMKEVFAFYKFER